MRLQPITLAALLAVFIDTPAQAATEKSLTLVAIFANAAVPVKLIAVILLVGLLAAPVVALARRDTKWLSAIARSALPLGFAAAAYTLLACAVGVANLGVTPSLPVLAPGLAEALMMAMLGLLTTGVARLASELVERRNHGAGLV
ncbi:hypothetical protein [Caulobacter sp. X]|uniref:hypothetical protein n=1 Tax=Caulobacter sp. X TaxID=2048901 RepID=UPI000C15FECA|nr:hypothetical protein [Caulobacter sp. X]PIC00218.1 hypothetical protein CSW60_01160 [Caulobacter sp. X]